MAGDLGTGKEVAPIGPPVFFNPDGPVPHLTEQLKRPLPQQPVKAGATVERTITVDGETRTYAVHVSKNWDGKSKLPVLYYFNGLHPGSNEAESFTGLSERADRQHFAVVYMRGTCRGNTYNNHQPIWGCPNTDENAYLNSVHKRLATQLPLEPRRQGLAGFSQGGSEAYDLASRNAWISSAQAVEGFTTGYELQLHRPIAEQSVHAVHDRISPFGGTPQIEKIAQREVDHELKTFGLIPDRSLNLIPAFHAIELALEEHGNYMQPHQAVVDIYKKANGITGKPEVTKSGPVTTYSYRSDKYGTDVQEVVLSNGTHGWAGSQDHSGDIHFMNLGVPSPDFSASDAIANFFLEHPLVKK